MPKPPSLPYLTRAESELMALFWEHGPMTVGQLHERVPDKAYTSLATVVKILETKGWLTHQPAQGSRAFVFAASVGPEKARRHHVRDLIDRLFGGRSGELVVGLLDGEQLSRAELEALREQIDAKLAKGKRR